jgi:hypothetical protein
MRKPLRLVALATTVLVAAAAFPAATLAVSPHLKGRNFGLI